MSDRADTPFVAVYAPIGRDGPLTFELLRQIGRAHV